MRDRFFEKISFEQFKKDIANDMELYREYVLPVRKTSYSCGYDFVAISDMILRPNEIIKIPTGYKAKFLNDEMLMLVVRSSMGFQYNIRMCNQVGIVDSDYYNNPSNEGHIWVALQNGGESDYVIKKGSSYCQGIIVKYFTCDDQVDMGRCGGIGSTDEERK